MDIGNALGLTSMNLIAEACKSTWHVADEGRKCSSRCHDLDIEATTMVSKPIKQQDQRCH